MKKQQAKIGAVEAEIDKNGEAKVVSVFIDVADGTCHSDYHCRAIEVIGFTYDEAITRAVKVLRGFGVTDM